MTDQAKNKHKKQNNASRDKHGLPHCFKDTINP